jgi:phosphate transport system protein
MLLNHDFAQMTAMVSQLGGLVEDRFRNSLGALQEQDVEAAEKIVSDQSLNNAGREIDRYALQLLALHHPYALELRAVVAGVRIASLLEQIGDSLISIARRVEVVSQAPRLSRAIAIPNLAQAVQKHLSDALNAFAERNAAAAVALLASDQAIDEAYHRIAQQIIGHIGEDRSLVAGYVALLQIAKNLESIGDNTVHIAEQIVFLVRGSYV